MEGGADHELLRAWGAGDKEAGAELVRRHYPSLLAFFRSKVADRPEDLAHRTLLVCLKKRERYEPSASLRGFLLGIGRNVLFDHFREVRKGAAFDPETTPLVDLAPSPSHVAAHHEQERILIAALRTIPIEHQITIELFYWEELSIDQVARALDVQPGTVKSRLHRARTQLRAAIVSLNVPEALARTTYEDLGHWAKSVHALLSASAALPEV